MGDFAKQIQSVPIEDELRQSYLDYSMSVIVSRALPDVRDGLKPVHRRILHAMRELNNGWDKPYKKSARVVGDVIGKYHPHGETAVYASIVRMAQFFSMRYTLIEGQGNFGSIDGDAPAAQRYTEIRMRKITEELIADMDKETVHFIPNYDNTESIPEVLPARAPNLLMNGSSGIAVGLATNIPPHNLGELLKAVKSLLKDPDISISKLMKDLPAPDFPTGGIIKGNAGIIEAYKTGRGRVIMRARVEKEPLKGSREAIIVTELPYQVNKAQLVERIALLVRDKKLQGISDLRDESDKDGIRVVIELRRGEIIDRVINSLYTHTSMQTTFPINMVALHEGRPHLLNIKEMLMAFIKHRREIITRRTLFLLRKARMRAHLLEGLAIAADNIDVIVTTIRNSATTEKAREALMKQAWAPSASLSKLLKEHHEEMYKPFNLPKEYGAQGTGSSLKYKLSPEQVKAILELRLQRLTGLEQDKIREEHQQLIGQIKEYIDIVSAPDKLEAVLQTELDTLAETYVDERRSELSEATVEFNTEDLIPNDNCVLTMTYAGYITSQTPDAYKSQKRGGQGSTAVSLKDNDVISEIMVARAHDTLLCFSNRAKVYWLRVFDIPSVGRNARGRPLINLLNLIEGERINAVLPIKNYSDDLHIIMVTANGMVKRIQLTEFARPMSAGVRALTLGTGDGLVGVQLANKTDDIMLLSRQGKCIRFPVNSLRSLSRTARGVRGMRLAKDDRVVAAIVPKSDMTICTVTQRGYGKRSSNTDFHRIGRGGKGVVGHQITKRSGELIGALQIKSDDELMLINNQGIAVRIKSEDISVQSRATQGARLMRIKGEQEFVSVARIAREDFTPQENGEKG